MSFEKWICTHCGAINPNRSYECHNCRNNGNYERIVIQGQRNMNTLDRLLELCSKATPVENDKPDNPWDGPNWTSFEAGAWGGRGYGIKLGPDNKNWLRTGELCIDPKDVLFVSAANPDTVKRLCELLKEAAPMLKEFEECGCNRVVESSMSKWLKKLEQLEKESA